MVADNRPYVELEFTGDTLTQHSSASNSLGGTNIVIDYGDGTTVNYNGDFSHTYSAIGDYTIRIYGVTSLGDYCFRNCSGLTSVSVPNSVTSIGRYCFYGCSGLTNVVISEGVTSIGDCCFLNCSSLSFVFIAYSVTSLGDNCFEGCSGLTYLEILDSVTSIGNNCFYGCSRLNSIRLYWNSSNDILTYKSNWIFNTDSSLVFKIPQGTTSLYEAKGYPVAKLVEQSPFANKTYQSLSIGGKTVKSLHINNKEIASITRVSDGLILYQKTQPDNYALTVVADKPILSYYDSESATLTATLTNNGVPVSGETVTFKAYQNDTLVETIGTDITDGSGEANVDYHSKGAGDLNIKVECMNLQEIFVIEDCTYYNPNQVSGSRTFNVSLPSTFTLEYVLKQGNSSYSSPYIDIGDSTNNRMLIGQYTRAGLNGLIVYKSSSTNYQYSTNIPVGQENLISFSYDGTDYTYSLNNGTPMVVSDKGITLSKLMHQEGANTTSNYIKDIKIKPL